MIRTPLLMASVALLLGSCVIAVGNEGVAQGSYNVVGPSVSQAICVLRGTEGNEDVEGVVTFTRKPDGVLIEATISGMEPGEHGFHIHEWGDINCTDGTCTGGHFNPTGAQHGGPDSVNRHAGDLGNIVVGEDGTGTYRRLDRIIMMHGYESIIGRAVIVHADKDDFTTQPTGNAGARGAAGVIGIAKID